MKFFTINKTISTVKTFFEQSCLYTELNCRKGLDHLFTDTTTIQEAIDILKNTEVKISIYSTYFMSNFDDSDAYNEYIRNSDVDIYNLVKYDNLKYSLDLVNYDIDIEYHIDTCEIEEILEINQKKYKYAIHDLINDLEEVEELFNDFNDCETLEDLANIDHDDLELFIKWGCDCDLYHNEESTNAIEQIKAIKKLNHYNKILTVKEETQTKKTKI